MDFNEIATKLLSGFTAASAVQRAKIYFIIGVVATVALVAAGFYAYHKIYESGKAEGVRVTLEQVEKEKKANEEKLSALEATSKLVATRAQEEIKDLEQKLSDLTNGQNPGSVVDRNGDPVICYKAKSIEKPAVKKQNNSANTGTVTNDSPAANTDTTPRQAIDDAQTDLYISKEFPMLWNSLANAAQASIQATIDRGKQ